MAHTAPYAVSKHSVVGFSEVLLHDLRAQNAKVGVSVLCPAFVFDQYLERGAQPPRGSRRAPETDADRSDKEAVRTLLDKKSDGRTGSGCAFDAVCVTTASTS